MIGREPAGHNVFQFGSPSPTWQPFRITDDNAEAASERVQSEIRIPLDKMNPSGQYLTIWLTVVLCSHGHSKAMRKLTAHGKEEKTCSIQRNRSITVLVATTR